jgi:hypothetical protein
LIGFYLGTDAMIDSRMNRVVDAGAFRSDEPMMIPPSPPSAKQKVESARMSSREDASFFIRQS